MFTEQTIEFNLRGHGPLAVHVLIQLVIFMTKQKILRKIFALLFTAKTLQKAMYLTSPYLG